MEQKSVTSRPPVLVYRDFLLPVSETFVRSQAEGLKRFIAYYAGLRRIEGLELPEERVITFQRRGPLGRVENGLMAFTGLAPRAMLRLRSLAPRLVHAHFGVDGSRIMHIARALRLPLIVTLHDYDVTMSDAELRQLSRYCSTYIRRRPRLARQARAFLAVSKFMKAKAVRRGFPERKIVVHYIGIDVSRFRERDHAAVTEPIVLFVGRLAEKKGLVYLIRAMADVQLKRPDAKLIIAGDGPLRTELEAEAAQTLKNYQFLGLQSSDQVRAWYPRARVFCGPSVTAQSGETEGLPITIMEAQASGLPVVSTEHAGIPEAVISGETGLLAPERDAPALTRHLLDVLDHPEFAARLGARAAEHMRANFNLEKQNAALEDIYTQHALPTRR
ncbi:MAG TPA: glycosyltransferase [Polyangiaceae bacterium]|nr:glycosyltransferase [Polyangiaceae bacterium]